MRGLGLLSVHFGRSAATCSKVPRSLGQHISADGCGEEQKQHDQQLVQAEASSLGAEMD